MYLPQYVKEVLSRLDSAGFESYVVGGCVRNFLLGLPCADYDITTSAMPWEVKSALSPLPVFETGSHHGTVTALVQDKTVEITTFREDSNYSDHRHPDSVRFSKDILCDLKRRDFTVNAMAYNEQQGLIDPYGGKKDLENNILRCVGDCNLRFCEDALRILRALRFSSQYGFCIEKETALSMLKNKELLHFVSKERILSELKKIICGKKVELVFSEFSEILFLILPELKTLQNSSIGSPSLWEHTLRYVNSLPDRFALRFAALFRFCGADIAKTSLKCLKSDRKTIAQVGLLLSNLPLKLQNNRSEIKHLLSVLSPETLFELILLEQTAPQYFHLKTDEEFSDIRQTAEDIIKSGECFSLSSLAVNGNDLASLGIHGKQTGTMLKVLLTDVIEGSLPNERSALLKCADEKKEKLP